MKTETVAQSFETYRQAVVPAGASDVQLQECRRAFYAGAYFLLMSLAFNIGDESTDEEDGIRQLEALKAECEAFAAAGGTPLPTPVEQSTYNVRSTDIEALLRELGRELKGRMPTGWGFVLLLSSFGPQGLPNEGPEGATFYLSSVERAGAIKLLQDFIRHNTQ